MADTVVSTVPVTAPSSDVTAALVERIHAVGPTLRENAVLADKNRVLPDASIAALESSGALNISALRRYGGYEGGARMLLEAGRAIGRYDPAAAWVTVISNGSVMLANRFDDELLDVIFAAGAVPMASIFASPQGTAAREGGGYRVNGEWPFSSNIMHSKWAIGILTVREAGDAEPVIAFAVFQKDEFWVKDSWYTIGMRGTGSNTMIVEDRWIPANRLVSFERLMGDGFERDPRQSFGRRLTPHLTMSTTIMSPLLGAAEAGLGLVRDKAHNRGITYTNYKRQVDSGAFVHGLGAASMKIDTALLQLRRSADAIDAAAAGTTAIPLAERARYRGGVGHAGHSLVESMTDLVWLHGTSSFAEFNPLGRLWRDVNTGARHASIAAPLSYELHGDGLLGVDYISSKL